MEIEQLRTRKKKLEGDITSQVSKLIQQFQQDTDTCVSYISINTTYSQEMDRQDLELIVTGTTVDILL